LAVKKTATRYLCYIVITCLLTLLSLPLNIASATIPLEALDEVEIWVKVDCQDKWQLSTIFPGPDEIYPDKPDGSLEEQDELGVTFEGTCKFKALNPYYYYDPDLSYPINIDYEVVERNFKISGSGGGDSYSKYYHQDTKWLGGDKYSTRWFLQEERYNWTYKILGPQYDKDIIGGLTITMDNENAIPHYEFDVGIDYNPGEYLEGWGTKNSTYRDFKGTRQESSEMEWPYRNASLASAFQNWTWEEDGGIAKGELSYDGKEFVDSGEITYNYKDSNGYATGSIHISYKINRKPGVKEIQPIQVLGRYEYNNDGDYVKATDFVAGKDTVIQVFLPNDVKAEEQSNGKVEIYRAGSKITTLSSFKKDTKNNTLIFIPSNRSSCGNWQAGTYKFVAKVGDSEELTLDNVFFREQRKLRVLAVPIKANYAGTVKTAGNQWKSGAAFMRRVYPVAYNNITYKQHSTYNASDSSYDITTNAGQYKLWQALNELQKKGSYDLIIGFIEDGITLPNGSVLQGYTYGPPSNIVVNSDQDMQATVAHEVAHIYEIGDEYQGGAYNLSVNSPPLGYRGTDWDDSSRTVTASDPKVKPYPGAQGALISEKLNPYDTGGRGLLGDSICFMGSGAAQSKNWISPSVWKHLFKTLAAPATTASISPNRVLQNATGGTRVVEASGLVSRTGDVEISLPWSSYNTTQPVVNQTGTYTIQAINAEGTVLASNGFTPTFFIRSNPPREIDLAPFKQVVPFPEGTHKFLIVDQNNTILTEYTVTANAPTVEITAPTAGQNLTSTNTITWNAEDADGDNLSYKVEYTPDGSNWELLAFDLKDNKWVQDFNQLPGGDKAQIRVTASDGVNSSIPATSAIFRVPLKGLEVFIEAPASESSFSTAEGGVVLQGSAYDPQEGQIYDDNRLIWTSDQVGELGCGPTVFTNKLTEGRHVITLTATNSTGQSISQSITLNISSEPTVEPDTYTELPAKTFTDPTKRTLIFNKAVNTSTLQNQIGIVGINGPIPINIKTGDDGMSALIYPLTGTFPVGEYTIYIDQGIQSSDGQPLKCGYKMTFYQN